MGESSMKKNILLVMLSMLFVFSLAGCRRTKTETPTETETTTPTETDTPTE